MLITAALLAMLGACGPGPASDAQGLNDPTASPPISAFDQVNRDAETWNRLKQVAVSYNQTKLYTRFYSDATHTWEPWQSQTVQDHTGLQWIRCISQSTRPRDPVDAKIPKQDFLSRDGATLYSRLFLNGQWQSATTLNVSSMGLPSGASTILGFDQEAPECATGGQYQQTALSEDGSTLYFRYAAEGSIGFGPWSTPVPVSSLGLPGNLACIRSFSQGVNPQGLVKQDVLSCDSKTLYTRFYDCPTNMWGDWNALDTSTMGFPP